MVSNLRHACRGIFAGALFAFAALAVTPASAQWFLPTWGGGEPSSSVSHGGDNTPGRFDFYLLALSWSPSYCEASRERGNRRADPQCGPRPYSFVVHGLWPQRERGFPSDCQVPSPRLSRAIVDSMLELMPSPRLVYHEWDRHGTCTGLGAAQYFNTIRQARGAVQVPAEYQAIGERLTVRPDEVADAFVRANPGLPRDALAVTCDGKRLTGINICMNKDLSFHDCAALSRRSCRANSVVMPPVRGARVDSH